MALWSKSTSAPKTPPRKEQETTWTSKYKKPAPTKKATGHDPARKKTGATKTTFGSTYDFRKGSQAPRPTSTKRESFGDKRSNKSAEKARAKAIKKAARAKRAAARKKMAAARKKARAEKRAARKKR
jgi:hypothetical protein